MIEIPKGIDTQSRRTLDLPTKNMAEVDNKEGATTITFDDLKTALADQKTGSDLDCSTTPKRKTRRKSCLSFWVPLPLVASPFGIKMLGVGKAAPAQFFGPGDLRIYGA